MVVTYAERCAACRKELSGWIRPTGPHRETRGTLYGAAHRGLVADCTLDDMLMQLPVQVDQGLTHPAVDDRHATGVWAGDGCVGRR